MECTKISVPLPIKPNVNSENVIKMLKENSSIKNECIRMFEEEIELLGEEDPTIIALGNKTLKILMDNFGGKYRIAKVPHYSYYLSEDDYRDEVEKVLERCR